MAGAAVVARGFTKKTAGSRRGGGYRQPTFLLEQLFRETFLADCTWRSERGADMSMPVRRPLSEERSAAGGQRGHPCRPAPSHAPFLLDRACACRRDTRISEQIHTCACGTSFVT